MKFGAPFQRTFYNLHFKVARGKYTIFLKSRERLYSYLSPQRAAEFSLELSRIFHRKWPSMMCLGIGMTDNDAMG